MLYRIEAEKAEVRKKGGQRKDTGRYLSVVLGPRQGDKARVLRLPVKDFVTGREIYREITLRLPQYAHWQFVLRTTSRSGT